MATFSLPDSASRLISSTTGLPPVGGDTMWVNMVEAYNREVQGLDDVEIWIHTCWGNPNMQKVYTGESYASSIDIYLNRLKGDVWTVEMTENDFAEIDLFKPYADKLTKKVAVGVVSHRTLQVKAERDSAAVQATLAALTRGAEGDDNLMHRLIDCANAYCTVGEMVSALKAVWGEEYDAWSKRSLAGKHYVYVWADGVHFNIRLEQDRQCILVLMGAAAEGKKELIAVENTRGGISKKSMIHNDATPKIEVDPETYEVRADGELLTCEPADELPLAQRYFLF